jgi:preprotein translocase subunit YajC
MDEILRDCIVSLVAISAIFGILYVLLLTRHRERMALMERGLSSAEFSNKNNVLSATLRYGLLFIGIAIGILFGNFAANLFDVPRQGAFIAMIFLFGGISLIISFLIDRKLNK